MVFGGMDMAGVFITAYSFVAAVIGAGFASGQEILSFFTVYGKWGALGIALAAFVFGWFAYFVLEACRSEGTDDYNELLGRIMSERMMRLSGVITFIFLLCSFAVMTACFGETAYLLFGLNKAVMSAVFAALCAAVIALGADKALKLNGALGVMIAAGITGAALYMLRFREHQTFAPQVSALVSGAGYSGYNLIGAGVILAKLSGNIRTRSGAALAGGLGAGALLVMMTLIYVLLSIYYKYINLGEIPMLTLAMRENKVITYFYGAMLVLAVVTTAISSGVGAVELVGNKKISRPAAAAAVSAAGLLISGAGFSAVINTAYRFCGYVGVILVLYMIIKYKKYKKDRK